MNHESEWFATTTYCLHFYAYVCFQFDFWNSFCTNNCANHSNFESFKENYVEQKESQVENICTLRYTSFLIQTNIEIKPNKAQSYQRLVRMMGSPQIFYTVFYYIIFKMCNICGAKYHRIFETPIWYLILFSIYIYKLFFYVNKSQVFLYKKKKKES